MKNTITIFLLFYVCFGFGQSDNNGISNSLDTTVLVTNTALLDTLQAFRDTLTTGGGATNHSVLTGLSNDDHTQYALLAGRTGGQILKGGTGTTDDLTLQTTAGVGASGADMHFLVGNNGATEAMTILNNSNIGVGVSPIYKFHLNGDFNLNSDGQFFRVSGARLFEKNGTRLDFGEGLTTLNFRPAGNTGFNISNPQSKVAVNGNFSVGAGYAGVYAAPTNGVIIEGNIGVATNTPTEALDINSDAIRIRTAQTPASASATGTPGVVCWDADYIYICVATDTWKRVAIATW